MPKTYPGPESKEQHERETESRKTVGIYDRPEKTGISREVIIAVAVIVALLLLFLFYRMAQGESFDSQTDRNFVQSQYLHQKDGVRYHTLVALSL